VGDTQPVGNYDDTRPGPGFGAAAHFERHSS